jgi:hypothetical protein
LSSVARHLHGWERLVVIGDRPPDVAGLNVDWIYSPQISPPKYKQLTGRRMTTPAKQFDFTFKLQKAIDSDLVSDRFLVLYDDHFFLDSVSVDELAVIRSPSLVSPGSEPKQGYQELVRQTYLELERRELPTWNHHFHGVACFDKQKLSHTIETFELCVNNWLLKPCYFNHWCPDPQPMDDALLYVNHKTADRDWPRLINLGNRVNHELISRIRDSV